MRIAEGAATNCRRYTSAYPMSELEVVKDLDQNARLPWAVVIKREIYLYKALNCIVTLSCLDLSCLLIHIIILKGKLTMTHRTQTYFVFSLQTEFSDNSGKFKERRHTNSAANCITPKSKDPAPNSKAIASIFTALATSLNSLRNESRRSHPERLKKTSSFPSLDCSQDWLLWLPRTDKFFNPQQTSAWMSRANLESSWRWQGMKQMTSSWTPKLLIYDPGSSNLGWVVWA